MKIFVIIFLCTIIQATASIAVAQKINLNVENASLSQVLKKIRNQSGYGFVYNEDLIDNYTSVNVKLENLTLTQALDQVFKNLPLTYSVDNKVVVIKAKVIRGVIEKNQAIRIDSLKGRVVDAVTKQPIPAVTILQNKRAVAQTNRDGYFAINVEVDAVLTFNYIGYKPKEITVSSNRTFLTVSLEESVAEMKDVVVNGLFARKASTSTGSSTSFTRDELLQVGNANVIQSLRNLDPSFQVFDNLQLGSDPNALPNITLRGQTGFPDLNGEYATNPNLPLFILDGFETTLQKVMDLDVYRLKSVTLLKDAASKSIYGSRAANGVVVIETVAPLAGKLRVTYNMDLNIEAPDLSSYNMTNAREKLQAEVLGNVYQNFSTYNYRNFYNQNLQYIEQGAETDWMSKPLRNGIGQRHSLQAEGGDAAMRYSINLGYNNVAGAMKGSDRDALTGSINLNYRTNNLSFNNILTLTQNKGTNSKWGDFSTFVAMNPYLPYYDGTGNIAKQISIVGVGGMGGNSQSELINNPAWNSTLNSVDETKYTDITNNFSVNYQILPTLRATGRFSLTKQSNSGDIFLPASHTMFTASEFNGTAANRRGRYTKADGEIFNYSSNLLLNYTKSFKKHVIAANGGVDLNSTSTENTSFAVEGFPNDKMDFVPLALQYQLNTRPTGTEISVRDVSAIFSANYAYNEKYLADFSYRGTQSSAYGSNAKWGEFWSAGIGWNLHNENFMKGLKIFNELRLRASTGYTGSQNANPSESLATYRYYLQNAYANNGNGANLIALANPDLKWQRRQDHNFGTNISILNRISLTFDYYISTTDGLLTSVTLPPSSGFSSYRANLGVAENRGFDFRSSVRILNDPATRSSLNLILAVSHNKNILKEVSNSLAAYNSTQDAIVTNRPRVRFIEGQSMNAIWAVPSLGIDPGTGREVYRKLDGTTTFEYDPRDQVVAGDNTPKYQGNAGFSWLYRGFQLSAMVRYEFGGQIYNQTLVDKVENANVRLGNVDRRVLTQRWRAPGDISFFKDIASTTTTQASTRFVEDYNRTSLATVNMSYDFDRLSFVKKAGFSRMRLGFQTNEVVEWSSVGIERGTSYPFARRYSFSLNFIY